MSQHASLRKRAATVAGRSNGATRTMKTYGKTTLLGVALISLTIVLLLVLTIGACNAQASPLVQKRAKSANVDSSGVLQHSSGDYNNFDSLISEFLDDRLKKSKQNSVRQIKQTLRFGRRSDPLMMPASELERDEGDLFDRFGGRQASMANED